MRPRWEAVRRQASSFGWGEEGSSWQRLARSAESAILEIVAQLAESEQPDGLTVRLLADLGREFERIELHAPSTPPGLAAAAREAWHQCAVAVLIGTVALARDGAVDAPSVGHAPAEPITRAQAVLGSLIVAAGLPLPDDVGVEDLLEALDDPDDLAPLASDVARVLETAWPGDDHAGLRSATRLRVARFLEPPAGASWTAPFAVADVAGGVAGNGVGRLFSFHFTPWHGAGPRTLVRQCPLDGVLLADDVVETVETEWQRSGAQSGTWSITSYDGRPVSSEEHVTGSSLAGTVRVVLAAARRDLALDPDVLIVAGTDSTNPNQLIAMPDSLEEKALAWRQPGHRLVLGPGVDNPRLRSQTSTVQVATVADLLDVAAFGVPTAVGRLLRPADEPVTAVFAELDRISRAPRPTSEAPLAPVVLEVVTDDHTDSTRAYRPEDLVEVVLDLSTDAATRFLVTAEPGQGKSTLAGMLVRLIGSVNEQGRRIPLVVRAEAVARDGLRTTVQTTLAARTRNARAATILADRPDRLVLLVDGLDQTERERELEADLVAWGGPLIMLGRPDVAAFASPDLHLQIRPLQPAEAARLFAEVAGALSGQEPEAFARPAQRLLRHPTAAPLAGNPMLVTLLAWWSLNGNQNLPPSAVLYRDLFRAMLTTAEHPVTNATADEVVEVLGTAVLQRRREAAHEGPRAPIPIVDLHELIRDGRFAGNGPVELPVMEVVQRSRLLQVIGGELRALHPSFLEHLCAVGLASELRRSARHGHALATLARRDIECRAGDPDWDVVIAHTWGLLPPAPILQGGASTDLRNAVLELVVRDGTDDVWLSRHATALACIAQHEGVADTELVTATLDRAWRYWWSFARLGTSVAFLEHLRRRLGVLGGTSGRRELVAKAIREAAAEPDESDASAQTGRLLLFAGIRPGSDLGASIPDIRAHPEDADVVVALAGLDVLGAETAVALVSDALAAVSSDGDRVTLAAALVRLQPDDTALIPFVQAWPSLVPSVLDRMAKSGDAVADWCRIVLSAEAPYATGSLLAWLAAHPDARTVPLAELRNGLDPETCPLADLVSLTRLHDRAAETVDQAEGRALRANLDARVLDCADPALLALSWQPGDLSVQVALHVQHVATRALGDDRAITFCVRIASELNRIGVQLDNSLLDALATAEKRRPRADERIGSILFDTRPTDPRARPAHRPGVAVPRPALRAIADLSHGRDVDIEASLAPWLPVADPGWLRAVSVLVQALGRTLSLPEVSLEPDLPGLLSTLVDAVGEAARQAGARGGRSRDLVYAIDQRTSSGRLATVLLLIAGRAVPTDPEVREVIRIAWTTWAQGDIGIPELASSTTAARRSGIAVPQTVVQVLDQPFYRRAIIDLLPVERQDELAQALVDQLRTPDRRPTINLELADLYRARQLHR